MENIQALETQANDKAYRIFTDLGQLILAHKQDPTEHMMELKAIVDQTEDLTERLKIILDQIALEEGVA